MAFKDRHEAGKLLAKELKKYKNNKDAIILAIPRGGLEIGYELARELSLPLDILITKKIGFPGNPEYAIGAAGPKKEYILNEDVILQSNISESYIKAEVEKLSSEIEEKYKRYKGKKKLSDLKDKIVIVADDGIATGYTMMLSLRIIKKMKARKIIAAIPVGPPEGVDKLREVADEVVCLSSPELFFAISQFYERFEQVSDEQAIKYLKEANE